jgi:hypothetical protein
MEGLYFKLEEEKHKLTNIVRTYKYSNQLILILDIIGYIAVIVKTYLSADFGIIIPIFIWFILRTYFANYREIYHVKMVIQEMYVENLEEKWRNYNQMLKLLKDGK